MLRDLGFAASVAAAYADARRPVEETVDRMLEDGVDFAEEPVYAGRERSSVAKRIANVGSRVLGRDVRDMRGACDAARGARQDDIEVSPLFYWWVLRCAAAPCTHQ